MLTKDELRILLEREGMSDFIYATDAFTHDGRTIYEMSNDYYAVMFRVFPPAYCGPQTEAILSSFFTCGFPKNTVLQFTSFASRNMQDHQFAYRSTHGSGVLSNVENTALLGELEQANMHFLRTHADESVKTLSGLQFYLRDFINLVTVMFPVRDSEGEDVPFGDIIDQINKAEGTLAKFSPMDFDEHRYIRMLREMIVPYDPLWNATRDRGFAIAEHVCNADSMLEDTGEGILRLYSSKKSDFEGQERDDSRKASPFERFIKRFNKNLNYKEYKPEFSTVKGGKKNGEYYAKVFTRKMFPDYIDMHSASDLVMDYFNQNAQQNIPLPFFVNLTVLLEDPEEAIASVKKDAQWNMYQLEHAGRLAKFFPQLRMRAEEANQIVNLIEREGEIPMKAMWSMVLYSTDRHELQRHAAFLQSSFRQKNWIIQDEDLIAIPAFLYSLPGQYHNIFRKWSRRFSTIFKSNASAIAPLVTDSRGFGQPVLMLYGRNGQPQALDFYAREASNKNAVLIGPSGKGKSFVMSKITWSYLNAGEDGKPGAKIRIIDSGHSYRGLCEQLGGQYITFPEGNTHCLNFFTGIQETEDGGIPEDDIGNIVGLIGVMAGIDLSNESDSNIENEYRTAVSSYITKAVTDAYKIAGTEAGMAEVSQALRNILAAQREASMMERHQYEGDIDSRLASLIAALSPFSEPEGPFYRYFNGTANVDMKKDLVVLDLDDLSSKEKRFRDVVLTAVLNSISREFYNERGDGRRKMLFIDEAWQLLDGKAGAFVLGLYRRSRKMQGSIFTITQSLEDFFTSEHIRGIYENAYWRLFLEQDPTSMANAEATGKLPLDSYALKLMGTVETKVGEYSEMMVLTQSGALMIGRIVATRVEYWINTQEESSLRRVAEIREQFHCSEEVARMAIGFSEANGTTVKHEVARLTKLYDRAVEELIDMEVAV